MTLWTGNSIASRLRAHVLCGRVSVTHGPEQQRPPAELEAFASVQQAYLVPVDNVSTPELCEDLIWHVEHSFHCPNSTRQSGFGSRAFESRRFDQPIGAFRVTALR